MAAPVRIEAEAFGDPRFDVLGTLLGTSRFDALGRMAHMWSWATDRGRMDVPLHIARVYFDGSSERAALVVAAELGEWVGCGENQQIDDSSQQSPSKSSRHPADCQHILIAGGAGRLEWLSERRSSKSEAGKKRAAAAQRGPDGAFLPKRPAHAGCAGPADHQHVTSTSPAQSSALSMSMSIYREDSATPLAGGGRPAQPVLDRIQEHLGDLGVARALGKRKPKPGEPTESESASARVVLDRLGAQNGVAYTGGAEHVRLIAARLRDGTSEADLCAVIAYCWTELDWKNKPDMAKYLRPETLFGPKTISKYLDPARSWAAKKPINSRAVAAAPSDADSPAPLLPWTLDAEAR